jgi:hypothetical protein
MDNKGHQGPSFIGVAFILQIESINNIIESPCHRNLDICCHYKGGFSRFGVLSGLPPLSLVDMLHAIGGGFGS